MLLDAFWTSSGWRKSWLSLTSNNLRFQPDGNGYHFPSVSTSLFLIIQISFKRFRLSLFIANQYKFRFIAKLIELIGIVAFLCDLIPGRSESCQYSSLNTPTFGHHFSPSLSPTASLLSTTMLGNIGDGCHRSLFGWHSTRLVKKIDLESVAALWISRGWLRFFCGRTKLELTSWQGYSKMDISTNQIDYWRVPTKHRVLGVPFQLRRTKPSK